MSFVCFLGPICQFVNLCDISQCFQFFKIANSKLKGVFQKSERNLFSIKTLKLVTKIGIMLTTDVFAFKLTKCNFSNTGIFRDLQAACLKLRTGLKIKMLWHAMLSQCAQTESILSNDLSVTFINFIIDGSECRVRIIHTNIHTQLRSVRPSPARITIHRNKLLLQPERPINVNETLLKRCSYNRVS